MLTLASCTPRHCGQKYFGNPRKTSFSSLSGMMRMVAGEVDLTITEYALISRSSPKSPLRCIETDEFLK
jgi:hypothetical protein